jgi:hypothetical protein
MMERQITKQNWLKVETSHGIYWVDAVTLGLHVRNSECVAQPLTDAERERYQKLIGQYVEGIPQAWENVRGYGARLSMPGYLDCTGVGGFRDRHRG